MDINTEFKEWFIRKWGQWDIDTGHRSTQFELARYLGISRSSVAQYVQGGQIPSGDNLKRIGKRWPEVYAIVGDPYSGFPEPLASRLRAAATEIEEMLNRGDFAPNSPEHFAAAREIFNRLGIDLNDISIEES